MAARAAIATQNTGAESMKSHVIDYSKVKFEYTEKKHCIVLQQCTLDSYLVQVVGDQRNAAYEYLIIKNYEVIRQSNDGYGQIGIALYEGLKLIIEDRNDLP